MRRRTTPRAPGGVALIGLVAGLALVIGPVALWWSGPSGIAPATTPASRAAAQPVAARDAPASAPSAPSVQPAAPVRVRVPDLGVDAAVVTVGVDRRGDMAVPRDVATVGWYRFGAGPGAPAGSVVLSGHVDDHLQGRGAFYRLGDAGAGDPVEVTRADGTVVRYRVTRTERVTKAALPADRIFALDGPPRLVLITCGGAFDRAALQYTDNVVVTAVPDGP